ncbi:MAG TPA: hypothetical protein VIO56_03070 [Methylotenera sp.]
MSNHKIMRDSSHPADTWIAIIGNAVNNWKRQNDWSRETVAEQIVQTHVNNNSHLATGIGFDTEGSGDQYRRQHTNANKIFRWLDEITKDNNLLPANFIKTILAALPMGLRLKTVNALLIDLDITANPINKTVVIDPLDMLKHILHETSDVNNAYAQLLDGVGPGELELALENTISAIAALEQARSSLQQRLAEKSNVKE